MKYHAEKFDPTKHPRQYRDFPAVIVGEDGIVQGGFSTREKAEKEAAGMTKDEEVENGN